jgi:hypothetical protein
MDAALGKYDDADFGTRLCRAMSRIRGAVVSFIYNQSDENSFDCSAILILNATVICAREKHELLAAPSRAPSQFELFA